MSSSLTGMRKDHILTNEEKLSKQKRLEENRRLRHSSVNQPFPLVHLIVSLVH